jgi:competence protein ComEA
MFDMRIFLLSGATLILAFAMQAQDLPEGKGKDTTEIICTACHGLDAIVTMHVAKDQWSDVVNDMKARGADGSNADFEDIISYLSKYFGPEVNVNKAPSKEIQDSLGLTADEADAIVNARPADGYKTLADLGKVQGVDMKKLEPLKDRIKFQ